MCWIQDVFAWFFINRAASALACIHSAFPPAMFTLLPLTHRTSKDARLQALVPCKQQSTAVDWPNLTQPEEGVAFHNDLGHMTSQLSGCGTQQLEFDVSQHRHAVPPAKPGAHVPVGLSSSQRRKDSPKAATRSSAAVLASHDDQVQPRRPAWAPGVVMAAGDGTPPPQMDADHQQYDQTQTVLQEREEPAGPDLYSGSCPIQPELSQLVAEALCSATGGSPCSSNSTATHSQPHQHPHTQQHRHASKPPEALQLPMPRQHWQQQLQWMAPVMPQAAQGAVVAAVNKMIASHPAPSPRTFQSSENRQHVGVRAAAVLLSSGECTPEYLSPRGQIAGCAKSHAAELEAALWATQLS